jgi:chromosome segregation ATPase
MDELSLVREENVQLKAQIQEFEGLNDKLQKALSFVKLLHAENAQLKPQLLQLQKHLLELEEGHTNDILQLETKLKDYQKDISNLENQNIHLQNVVIDNTQFVNDAQLQIQTFKDEMNTDKTELAAVRTRLEMEATKVANLEQVLKQFEDCSFV